MYIYYFYYYKLANRNYDTKTSKPKEIIKSIIKSITL